MYTHNYVGPTTTIHAVALCVIHHVIMRVCNSIPIKYNSHARHTSHRYTFQASFIPTPSLSCIRFITALPQELQKKQHLMIKLKRGYFHQTDLPGFFISNDHLVMFLGTFCIEQLVPRLKWIFLCSLDYLPHTQ